MSIPHRSKLQKKEEGTHLHSLLRIEQVLKEREGVIVSLWLNNKR